MTILFCRLLSFHLLSVFYYLCIVQGFNLETRLPVVKRGNIGSYFGYSVAAHQIHHEHGSVAESLLLVGAPLDQNLQPNTTRSGALLKCPLTSKLNDCVQVITDGRKDWLTESYNNKKDLDINDLFPPGPSEIKTDQWLGVTVKSQGSGGKVMVCAHRYGLNATNDVAGLGLCYILKQNLEFENAYVHCKGRQGNHVQFGVCQSGTSGLIFDDENAIIGAPGAMTWRGAVFVFSISENYLHRNPFVYTGNGTNYGDIADPNERIKKDGCMGMSLAAGYFIGDNITVYVAGAPRANETGQVVLFTKNMDSISANNNLYLREYLIIGGEQIASNFGYEVIGADVNGDKLPDLIVAAPFYFNVTTREGGAIYIYLNDPIKHLRDTIPIRITGKFESRFGFALASLGDLNKDGFEDIAVGAPYEGNGVVYIYLGSKSGLISKPSQIIKAETLHTTVPISTFGYSLSGGMDLDENSYPDLVIGAYEKDAVVLLRARPIIGFTAYLKSSLNLTNFDPGIKNCFVDNKNYSAACFHFETCCKIDSVVKIYWKSNHYVNYTLEAETFNNQFKSSRIWFDDFENRSHRITKEINIVDTNQEFCQKHVAFLKETARDIQSPIQIRMSYSLNDHEPQQTDEKLVSLDDFPILNQLEADKVFNATFLKDCASKYVCESKLKLTADFSLKPLKEIDGEKPHYYQMVLGDDMKVILNVSVVNLKESAYETKLFVNLPEMVDFGRIISTPNEKKQYICSAQNAFVICELANPLKENEVANVFLELDMQKVNESQPWLDFKISTNTTSDDENNKLEPLKLSVKVIANTTLSISGRSEPEELPEYMNELAKGESVYHYKDEIGSRVAHVYTIQNNGPWHVSRVNVKIEWPFQVANNKEQGKWLLYMDERPTVEGSGGTGRCDVLPSFVNPLTLKDRSLELNGTVSAPFFPSDKFLPSEKSTLSSKNLYNRVKRDVEMTVIPETYTDKDGKKYKVVKMNCLLHTAKCFEIRCTLDSIGSKQFLNIVIKARLWRATLIDDYANVDHVKVASRAKMSIAQSSVSLENIFSNEFQVETRAMVKPPDQRPAAPVPFYIIITAIVIGLLLFILLTLLLWKLGFFKRRRPDPTLSGNLEKHKIEEYHDY